MTTRQLPALSVAFLSVAIVSAQALSDHAAAVAGAAAGVAGATAIRDPLTRLLNSAAGTTDNAAAESPKTKAKQNAKAAGAQEQPASAPATNAGTDSAAPAVPGRSRPFLSGPVLSVRQPSFNRYENAYAPLPVTSAQLRSLAAGESSGHVIENLGTPAATITMEDSGHLVEILQYTANGNRVGSVRCSDGRVESVNTADR